MRLESDGCGPVKLALCAQGSTDRRVFFSVTRSTDSFLGNEHKFPSRTGDIEYNQRLQLCEVNQEEVEVADLAG